MKLDDIAKLVNPPTSGTRACFKRCRQIGHGSLSKRNVNQMNQEYFALTNWSATSFTEFECWGVRCAVASPARALKIADRSQSVVRVTACDPRSVPTPEPWIQKEQCHRGIWHGGLFPALFPSYLKSSRSTLSSQKATFSTIKDDRPQKTPPSPGNPSYPAFSFEDLGANRTIKVAVIACLTVIGTIESILGQSFVGQDLKIN
jgi:hypothetical protein